MAKRAARAKTEAGDGNLPVEAKALTPQQEIDELSIQPRAQPKAVPETTASVMWFVQSGGDDEIAAWWSEQRDVGLREFWMLPGNDILAGAVSSMVKKFKAMSWVVEGPQRVVGHYQNVLSEAEFGHGWGTLLGKTLTDYLTQDKGAFWELIGRGKPDEAIEGKVLGVAHLDSAACQLTGDPVYPVLYRTPKDKISHKMHATRVVHLVDMPSPNQGMNSIGFCAVSRVIAASNVLLKLAKYKNEKLSDLPQSGLLLFNNLMPTKWEDATANYQRERRRMGQELWTNVMTLFGIDPAHPVSAEFINFAGLPDAFDEREATDIYVNIVALAFGVDVREFWPLSAGPMGTAAETLIMHQKARGKGVGDIVSTLERVVNWKILAPSVSFGFDFRDDEEDRQRAELDKARTETIMSMWQPPKAEGEEMPVTRAELRQMLADNVGDYFKEDFLEVDVTEEVEATDTEREEKQMMRDRFGPRVSMDHKGVVRPLDGRRNGRLAVDEVLTAVEHNYRAGLVEAEDLAEFAMGELLDRRRANGG